MTATAQLDDLPLFAHLRGGFDGVTIAEDPDAPRRLAGQLQRVHDLMIDGTWRSLSAIASQVEGTEASVSARLRDLRKVRFGLHDVERDHRGKGLFLYRVRAGQCCEMCER